MKNYKSQITQLLLCSALLLGLASGCAVMREEINTKDVTGLTVTTTGLRIGQSSIDKTPELSIGRHQVQYTKVPTGLNATNATSSDVTKTPAVVTSYEANGHSVVFGNASVTSTFATDQAGVTTTIGGQHTPINDKTGLNNPAPAPVPAVAPSAGSAASAASAAAAAIPAVVK